MAFFLSSAHAQVDFDCEEMGECANVRLPRSELSDIARVLSIAGTSHSLCEFGRNELGWPSRDLGGEAIDCAVIAADRELLPEGRRRRSCGGNMLTGDDTTFFAGRFQRYLEKQLTEGLSGLRATRNCFAATRPSSECRQTLEQVRGAIDRAYPSMVRSLHAGWTTAHILPPADRNNASASERAYLGASGRSQREHPERFQDRREQRKRQARGQLAEWFSRTGSYSHPRSSLVPDGTVAQASMSPLRQEASEREMLDTIVRAIYQTSSEGRGIVQRAFPGLGLEQILDTRLPLAERREQVVSLIAAADMPLCQGCLLRAERELWERQQSAQKQYFALMGANPILAFLRTSPAQGLRDADIVAAYDQLIQRAEALRQKALNRSMGPDELKLYAPMMNQFLRMCSLSEHSARMCGEAQKWSTQTRFNQAIQGIALGAVNTGACLAVAGPVSLGVCAATTLGSAAARAVVHGMTAQDLSSAAHTTDFAASARVNYQNLNAMEQLVYADVANMMVTTGLRAVDVIRLYFPSVSPRVRAALGAQ